MRVAVLNPAAELLGSGQNGEIYRRRLEWLLQHATQLSIESLERLSYGRKRLNLRSKLKGPCIGGLTLLAGSAKTFAALDRSNNLEKKYAYAHTAVSNAFSVEKLDGRHGQLRSSVLLSRSDPMRKSRLFDILDCFRQYEKGSGMRKDTHVLICHDKFSRGHSFSMLRQLY